MKYTLNYTYDPHNKDVQSSMFQALIDNGYTALMMNDIYFEMFTRKFMPDHWTKEEMEERT